MNARRPLPDVPAAIVVSASNGRKRPGAAHTRTERAVRGRHAGAHAVDLRRRVGAACVQRGWVVEVRRAHPPSPQLVQFLCVILGGPILSYSLQQVNPPNWGGRKTTRPARWNLHMSRSCECESYEECIFDLRRYVRFSIPMRTYKTVFAKLPIHSDEYAVKAGLRGTERENRGGTARRFWTVDCRCSARARQSAEPLKGVHRCVYPYSFGSARFSPAS